MESEKKVRTFLKINFEDLEIAAEYFENNRHLNEFILAVTHYYWGKDFQIHSKKVLKYFKVYTKTMNFIINSVKSGKQGAEQKTKNQIITNDTLKGVVEVPLQATLEATLPTNSKVVIVNSKDKIEKEKEVAQRSLRFDKFWTLYPKKVEKEKCKAIFAKLKNDEQETILETLPKFINYKPFDTYNHPNPKTYLNGKRWNDVIPDALKLTFTNELNPTGVRAPFNFG